MKHAPPPLGAAVAALLLTTACAGVSLDTDAAWLRARTLPAASDDGAALAPLVDCRPASAEAALCGRDEASRADVETTCRALLDDPSTAFTGHRCLAHLALARAETVVVRHGAAPDDPDALPTEHVVADLEALAFEQWADQLAQALEHLERAAELAPDLRDLHHHRLALATTLALHATDDDARAEAARATALEAAAAIARLDPRAADLETLRRHARALLLAEQTRTADALLTVALAAHPRATVLAGDLGLLRLAEARFDEARTLLDTAVEAEHPNPTALAGRVELALLDGQLELAATTAARAPHAAASHEVIAIVLALGAPGLLDSALPQPTAELVARLDAAREEAAALAALAAELAGTHPAAALALALAAADREPHHLEPALARSQALASGYGLHPQAAAALVELLERLEQDGAEPPDATLDQVRLFTADALLAAHQPADAGATLDRVDPASHDAAYHYLRGRERAAQGDRAAATTAFEAVRADPEAGPLAEAARRELDALHH